jgi:hypothetical protein
VDPRAGLDVSEKSRPHRDFFFISVRILCFIVLVLNFQWSFVSYRTDAVDFSSRKNPTASVGSEPAILGTRGQHANP